MFRFSGLQRVNGSDEEEKGSLSSEEDQDEFFDGKAKWIRE